MDEIAFLEAIAQQPADDAARLIYADWLEERGDRRADYLRLVVEIAQRLARQADWDELAPPLRRFCDELPHDWRASAGARVDVVLIAAENGHVIDTIGAIKTFIGMGLKEAKELAWQAPVTLRRGELLEDAVRLQFQLQYGNWSRAPRGVSESRCQIMLRPMS